MSRKLFKLALMYILAWCISPPLSYGTLYRLLALLFVGGFILYECMRGVSKKQAAIVGLMAYVIVIAFVSGDSLSYVTTPVILLAFALFGDMVVDRYAAEDDLSWLITFAFALFIVWNICTLINLQISPNIMRVLAKNSDVSFDYAMRGVGGYGYMYTCLAALPLGLAHTFDRQKGLISRLTALAFSVTTFILALESQYLMAALVAILMPILFGIFSIRNIKVKAVLIMVALVGFTLLYLNIEKLLTWLIGLTDQTGAIARKLQDLLDLIRGESVEDSDFATRIERYANSLNMIVKYPVTGTLTYMRVGKHSTILDLLAQYGLIFGMLIAKVQLVDPLRTHLGEASAKAVAFVAILLIGTFNVIPFAMGAILFILYRIYDFERGWE